MRTGLLAGLMFLLCPSVLAAAAHTDAGDGGRILDGVEAEQADTAALTAETNIFKSIGMGIALSIAQCEELADCSAIINPDELGQLLGVLDNRINRLVTLQEEGKGDFTQILTAYVDQRESYLRYQSQLEEIIGPDITGTEGETTGDTFGDEGAAGEQLDLSVFQDADEALEDLEDALPEEEVPAAEDVPENQ
jgi:hypothetical protein